MEKKIYEMPHVKVVKMESNGMMACSGINGTGDGLDLDFGGNASDSGISDAYFQPKQRLGTLVICFFKHNHSKRLPYALM